VIRTVGAMPTAEPNPRYDAPDDDDPVPDGWK
jgi:hypothetical protein